MRQESDRHLRKAATLCRRTSTRNEQIRMWVSTRKEGDVVLLRLRPVPASCKTPGPPKERASG